MITGQLLKILPRRSHFKGNIIKAALSQRYVLEQWTLAEVLKSPESGKSTNDIVAYRPISLTPLILKLFENLLLLGLKPILTKRN